MEKLINNLSKFILDLVGYNTINILAKLMLVVIVILVFLLVFRLGKGFDSESRVNGILQNAMNAIALSSQETKIKKLNYSYIETLLLRNGIKYKFKWLDPVKYILINIALSLFTGWFLSAIELGLAIPGMILGYFAFDLYIKYSNSSDNSEMMNDIKIVFTTLKLQTKAGRYITSALTEAFAVVKNKRLKDAILELNGDIINDRSISNAVDKFNAKFNNSYIDSLSVIIKQSSESGQAAQSFKDIEIQLDEIQSAMVIEEKKKISTQVLIVQLMIYGAIIGSILYGTILSIFDSGIL